MYGLFFFATVEMRGSVDFCRVAFLGSFCSLFVNLGKIKSEVPIKGWCA